MNSASKTAIVTGSSGGIGVQVAIQLASAGFNVVLNGRNPNEKTANIQRKIEALGAGCQFVAADVSQEQDCQFLIDETIRRFSSVDVLVNNAGPYIFEHKPLLEYTRDEWRQMVDGNLSSVFYLCKLTLPLMREKGFGRIITYGFTGAGQASGWPGRSAYAAAKTALVSLTKTLAQEEKGHGITVNMVCPGDIMGEDKELGIADVKRKVGFANRAGSGEDVARVIELLCHRDSDYITGSIIDVNGGTKLEDIET